MFPIGIDNFSDIFSGFSLVALISISAINAALLFFASIKFMLVLQQSGYHGKKYFKWLLSPETPYMSRFMLLCLLGFLFFCVLGTCFSYVGNVAASYVGFASYLVFIITYIDSEKNVNAKAPLKRTKRLVRLSITYCAFRGDFRAFGFAQLYRLRYRKRNRRYTQIFSHLRNAPFMSVSFVFGILRQRTV